MESLRKFGNPALAVAFLAFFNSSSIADTVDETYLGQSGSVPFDEVDWARTLHHSEISDGRAFYSIASSTLGYSEFNYDATLKLIGKEMQTDSDGAIRTLAEFEESMRPLKGEREKILNSRLCGMKDAPDEFGSRMAAYEEDMEKLYEDIYQRYKKQMSAQQANKLQEWVDYNKRKMKVVVIDHEQHHHQYGTKTKMIDRISDRCVK